MEKPAVFVYVNMIYAEPGDKQELLCFCQKFPLVLSSNTLASQVDGVCDTISGMVKDYLVRGVADRLDT